MASSTALKFSLKVGSLSPDTFRVLEFTLDEAISTCFRLQIQAGSGNPDIAYEDMVGQSATLEVDGQDFSVSHHGIVTEFNQFPDPGESHGQGCFLYDLNIEPRFKLLGYTTQNRVFQKLDARDIVTQVLVDAGLSPGADFDFQATDAFPRREYTVQYNESDLHFVQRLLEDEGIWYFFDHEGAREKLVLANQIYQVRPIPHTPEILYHPGAGLSHTAQDHVLKVKRTQKMVTGKVTLKDYNSDTPHVDVIGRASKPGQGEMYAYAPHVKDASGASRTAALRAEMLACGKIRLDGEGICRAFRSGYRFHMTESAAGPFGGDYTLVRIIHHGDQREGFEGEEPKLIYSNRFACMPASVVFRPHLGTPKPRIHGVLTARVDGPEDKYAALDEEGRYRLKLPFDLSDRADGQASLPVRMAQPYAGPDYGMHFPVHAGNDVVLGFVDGDVDRPIGLGSVPNPASRSPVSDRNKSESIIRTASGHQIRMDDKERKTAIEITTHGGHFLSLNDTVAGQEIRIRTADGNEMIFDDTRKSIRIATPGGAHLVKLDYGKHVLSAETKYGHKLTMDDEARALALQTRDGHILRLDDDRQLLALEDGKGKHKLRIDAGEGLVSITTEGDLRFAAKGTLSIEAREITLEAKQGAISAKASKDIILEAMNVSAKAAQKLALEATMDASLKGLNVKLESKLNVESKAGIQNKMTGVMTSVESQAINTIKGAMVMIN